MVFMEENISTIGRLLPRNTVRMIGDLTAATGTDLPEEYVSGAIIAITAVTLLLSLIILAVIGVDILLTIGGAIVVTFIVIGLIYQIALSKIDERRNAVDTVLPEFLQLAAANIRAGMQLDKALWYAAKPEFGILAEEVGMTSKRVFSGETIEEALDMLSKRFHSKHLERTVELVKEGITSGGEMAGILEKTALDLRNLQLMQKEISASMIMYSIFIAFSSAIGAPFLYVVSLKLIDMLEELAIDLPFSGGGAQFSQFRPTSLGLTSVEFALFSVALVIVTSTIASIIIAVIQTGKKQNFVKYILPFLAVSLIVFYLGRFLVDQLL